MTKRKNKTNSTEVIKNNNLSLVLQQTQQDLLTEIFLFSVLQ